MPPKRKKKQTRSRLVKMLDALFSKFIRRKYSDKDGNCKCYTCGKIDRWENMQCGHFISRGVYKYRWDADNCRPQCVGCNVFLNGNYKIYTIRMIDELGREKVEEMMNDKKPHQIASWQIEERIDSYKTILKG